MPEHDSIWAHRILVVDANRVDQLVAGAMLQRLGFSVDVVVDGGEAVAAVDRTHYRGILMDCQILGPDGYQATAMIRRREDRDRHIPIIAVTATANPANRQRCLAAGMDDYLGKPLDPAELAAALARCGLRGSGDAIVDPAPADVLLDAEDGLAHEARAEHPVLDPEVVAQLEQLGVATGEDLMEQLAVLFLANSLELTAALFAGLAGHDPAAVAMAAHTLRGASANIGATDLARRCAWMETHGIAGDLSRGAALLDAITEELRRVQVALEQWTPAPVEAS
jgi:two-component system sensor histidine kinase/response regulator